MIFATIEKPNDYSEGTFKITQVSYYQLRVATTGLNSKYGVSCKFRVGIGAPNPDFRSNPL